MKCMLHYASDANVDECIDSTILDQNWGVTHGTIINKLKLNKKYIYLPLS